jgi:hypothetical protein
MWWNSHPIRWYNLTCNNVPQNDRRASYTTPNLLATPHRILYPNINSQIPPTRCDFSQNPIPMPVDCWWLWYRRTETQYFNFYQCIGEGIRLSTKFSEICIRALPAYRRKSKKAYCSWSSFWTTNSRLNSTKCRNWHTCYEIRNQALLDELMTNSNHSELGKFICSSLAWWDFPHEKCHSRRAALTSNTSVPLENNPKSEEISPEIYTWTDFQSRRSWYFGLGRSQNEEHRRTVDETRQHDRSQNISKCQTYLGDCLCLDYWKITHPLRESVAGSYLGPKSAQETQCSIRNWFGLEVESETIYQRGHVLITSEPYSYLILLNSVQWMNLLKKWPFDWWIIGWVTSRVIWSIFSSRHESTS